MHCIPHVALLIDTARSYGRDLLHGIQQYIAKHGRWSVYIEQRELHPQTPRWLAKWNGDGILVRTSSPRMAEAVVSAGVPTVELQSSRLMSQFPYVGCDDSSTGQMVAEHLLERGFRNFAVYGNPLEESYECRCQSFVRTISSAGFEAHICDQDKDRVQHYDWAMEQSIVTQWVKELPKPVGIIACTDQWGFWLLKACERANVTVPDEVAVVGCGNDESLATMSVPPMSSVRFNACRTGYEAASLLDRLLRGENAGDMSLLVPPLEVVTRQSSDILAVDDEEIAAALRYIHAHAFRGINVRDVLRAVPISRRLLDHKMRRCIGRSAKSEIVRVQLNKVKRLLRDTDMSLAQIAAVSGFRHPQYLAGLFKKKFGVTPGTYRGGLQVQK